MISSRLTKMLGLLHCWEWSSYWTFLNYNQIQQAVQNVLKTVFVRHFFKVLINRRWFKEVMGLNKFITVQWNLFTRKFIVGNKSWLRIELGELNCVAFALFCHSNAKYLISKNIDFFGVGASHAFSLWEAVFYLWIITL